MIKKILKIMFVVILIMPFVLYGAICIANNCIAGGIVRELKGYPVPENTEIVDSISVAGKLTGNGNGMQYMGSILVTSELSKKELSEYYGEHFDHVEVRKQASPNIDFINSNIYSFGSFEDEFSDTYYSVTCWDYNSSIHENELLSELLNFDLRGH